jgi:dihydrodipicolinate synthase/N-acetylneuraminate lyase
MRELLKGVWVAMPTPWQADGNVDAGVVCELVNCCAEAGLHGAYTTGTDGELHVMEAGELAQLVPPFAETAVSAGLPVQVGCGWSHTDGTIDRVRIAAASGVGIVQISLPSWIPLDDAELLRFYGDIQDASPDMLLVHYNIAKSGRFLTGRDYRAILSVAPNLAGSKHTGGNMSALAEIIDATPELAHFAVDSDIVAGALYGSPGFYSFVANLSPSFALEMMTACQKGDWQTAARYAKSWLRLVRTWTALCPEINSSSALAKIATAAGVLPEMPLFVKRPYTSGTAHHVAQLRELIDRDFPEFRADREKNVPTQEQS